MEKLKLKKKQVHRCEACNGFHDEKDMEIVTIQVVKGKDCSMDNLFAPKTNAWDDMARVPKAIPNALVVPKEDIQKVEQPPVKRRNVIPPDIANLMKPPGDI